MECLRQKIASAEEQLHSATASRKSCADHVHCLQQQALKLSDAVAAASADKASASDACSAKIRSELRRAREAAERAEGELKMADLDVEKADEVFSSLKAVVTVVVIGG
eukprot:2584410-Pleurochrysis_carterae.AAC.2